MARKPTYDRLLREYLNTLIHTSGPFVGLPEGQMGNSEVGHMNIGAGRIVHMDITRIDLLIANKQLQSVPLFQQAMERGRQRQYVEPPQKSQHPHRGVNVQARRKTHHYQQSGEFRAGRDQRRNQRK